MKYTIENLLKAISSLDSQIWYEYISQTTKTQVRVVSISQPNGPIQIERKTKGIISSSTISNSMLVRVLNFIEEGVPFNIDRILGASYNSRSALETLLAHTPEFYWCRPGRLERDEIGEKLKPGHKHLIWLPKNPHNLGKLVEHKVSNSLAIAELPVKSVVYEALTLNKSSELDIDLETKRRHIQIQVLLAYIGNFLGYRTWIANNDRGHLVQGKRLSEIEGVLSELNEVKVLQSYPEAIKNALLIDCIWLTDRSIPAVFEVEHSTGVTSGLSRMKKFQDECPNIADISWVIAGPDEIRNEVFNKASVKQFNSLNAHFMSYSSIEEFYDLCKRGKITAESVNENIIRNFMETIID